VRLLFLHPALDFTDGTFRLLASVAAARDAGHQVQVLTGEARRADSWLAEGVECFEVELPRPGSRGHFAAGRLRRRVAELGPDLLHVTDGRLASVSARMADTLQLPYLLEVVRPPAATLRRSARWQRALVLPSATFVEAAVNRGGVPRDLLRVVEHGPDVSAGLAPRANFEERRPVLMSTGTLDREHGFDVLIEGLHLLQREGRRPCALILGEGPEEEGLRRQVRELGLAESVAITAPTVPDLDLVLGQADLFVSAARSGCPNWTEVRALGLGIPTLCTGRSSTFAAIEDKVDGVLIERGDPRKLAEAVGMLLDNPAAASGMGVQARNRMLERDGARIFREALAGLWAEALGAVPA